MDEQESIQDIFLNEETVARLHSSRVKHTDEIQTPPAVLQIDTGDPYGLDIFTEGNISVIKGQAKARKSFAISAMVAGMMQMNWTCGFRGKKFKRVIYFDTEQSKYHVQIIAKRIAKMVGSEHMDRFECYALRPYTSKQRTELIEYMFYNSDKTALIIVDGVRDLMQNINSATESTEIVNKLLRWTDDTKIHLTCVIHENPSLEGGGKARGHIGTELMNKAEAVIEIEKLRDPNEHVSKIKPYMMRGRSFDALYFEIEDGLPKLIRGFNEDNQFNAS